LASESDYGTVGRIDSIAGAVAPEEVEAGIQLDPRHQLCGQRGMDVEEVAGAECGFVAKVVATRVEGIEGAETVVVGILVAAGYGDEQGQPRSASDLAERIAGVSRKRPGADAGVAKAATLDKRFPVPVPRIAVAVHPGTEGPASLVRDTLDVAGEGVFVMQRVDVPGRGGCGADRVDATQCLRRRAGIVETALAVLARGRGECIYAPAPLARIRADGLEAAAHIGALPC